MTVTNGDLFARFSFAKSRITCDRVKHKLFQPSKDGTLSVQTIDDLDRGEIKTEGECVRKERDEKKLYGWAKICRSVIEGTSLTVDIDNNPRCGHATVRGWPDEKNAISDKQKHLANASHPVLL